MPPADDLAQAFPTSAAYHADPERVTRQWRGTRADPVEVFQWPDDGPGFRPAQHRWMAAFPFGGGGALNRLCVHPAIVDFAERALEDDDIRLYQAHASAKYSGVTNYEQPMHIDRNHSWLPAGTAAPWWNLEGFLYLSDVGDDDNPTRLVSVRHSAHLGESTPVVMPDTDPALYRSEVRASGVRGSYLAYRSDVFHRAAPFGSEGTARFVLALAFKRAGQDWIAYDQAQSDSTGAEWISFAEQATPRELALFGFPPPGPPDLDRGAAGPGGCPLSGAGPHPVAGRASHRAGLNDRRVGTGRCSVGADGQAVDEGGAGLGAESAHHPLARMLDGHVVALLGTHRELVPAGGV